MAMPYGANREHDDQELIQQMMGGSPIRDAMLRGGQVAAERYGSQRINQTQPAGAPMAYQRGGGGQADTSFDTPEESRARQDLMGLGMAPPNLGGGGSATRDDRDRLTYSTTGSMSGFNTGDYGGDVKARNSVKNTFGRIASRYKNAPSQIDAIFADPEFQKYFPNASKVAGGAGDKIDFGGVLSDFESGTPVGIVDVLQAADPNSDTAENWAWMPDGEGGGQIVPGGGGDVLSMLMGGGQGPSVDQLGQGDVLAQIMAALQQDQMGQQNPQAQALLQSLMGR